MAASSCFFMIFLIPLSYLHLANLQKICYKNKYKELYCSTIISKKRGYFMQQEYMAEEITVDLFAIAKALWKKLWLILLVGALLGGAMFARGKTTFVPEYEAAAIMCARLNAQEDEPLLNVDKLTGTCIAVLKTRMTLEEVAASCGLDVTYGKISGMVSAAAVTNSPLFRIVVSGTNPDDIAQIANTAADILPGKVHSVYDACEVSVIDYALVPTVPSNSDTAAKDALTSAILGMMVVCCIIVAKELYTDRKTAKEQKNAQ